MSTDNSDDADDGFGFTFGECVNSLTNVPQFQAIGVMSQSLDGVLEQMTDAQQRATRKLMAQFARALDEAGMLVTQSTEDLH